MKVNIRENTGTDPFEVSEAFHPYFAVTDDGTRDDRTADGARLPAKNIRLKNIHVEKSAKPSTAENAELSVEDCDR